ncbi:MAG: ABC transporter ATP-binding protein [Defluviitaleaceae bacterium]|nr:ABC transporter ATP-binding protein [Defluviitaleaceae bacterium]
MKLKVDNLQKKFDKKVVLTGASYTFEQGKIYGLLGRNGAGKTTMFNCLTSNLQLDGGEVLIESGGETRKATFDDIGFVFTQPHLPEFMTGNEFLKFFTEINREKIAEPVDFAAAFASVELDEEARFKLIKDYSHGMQNKLQMLAFLVLRPPVILLDEPLTSFDVVAALQIKNLIKSIKSEHIIIFSTHILELAQDLCDEITILHGGKLSKLDIDRLQDADFGDQIMRILSEEVTEETPDSSHEPAKSEVSP